MTENGPTELQWDVIAPPEEDDILPHSTEEFLASGTGVEESYSTYQVTIEFETTSYSHPSPYATKTWSIELCARCTEDAQTIAVRDFRLIEEIANQPETRKIISVSVFTTP